MTLHHDVADVGGRGADQVHDWKVLCTQAPDQLGAGAASCPNPRPARISQWTQSPGRRELLRAGPSNSQSCREDV
jgi:hypothetical protein